MAIAAMMPMIATTISSSIRVNPCGVRLIVVAPSSQCDRPGACRILHRREQLPYQARVWSPGANRGASTRNGVWRRGPGLADLTFHVSRRPIAGTAAGAPGKRRAGDRCSSPTRESQDAARGCGTEPWLVEPSAVRPRAGENEDY